MITNILDDIMTITNHFIPQRFNLTLFRHWNVFEVLPPERCNKGFAKNSLGCGHFQNLKAAFLFKHFLDRLTTGFIGMSLTWA